MSKKEASARLKINKLLEESGWRLFDAENGKNDWERTAAPLFLFLGVNK